MDEQYYKIEVSSYIDKLMNNLWNETLMGSTKTIFFNTKESESFSRIYEFLFTKYLAKNKNISSKD